jgi:muconolactone delta-isomerase
MYGRKYGLRVLKDAPDEVDILHAKAEDLSQNVAKINYAKQIKLTKVSGNWALVSVFDLDRIPKMGYIKWRGNNGIIYAFPNIK